jgi:hypothetical protein
MNLLRRRLDLLAARVGIPGDGAADHHAIVDELLNFAWLDNDELLRFEGEIRNALAVALDDGDDALVEVVNFWSGLTRRRREACEPPRS